MMEYEITTITAKANLGFAVNLNKLALNLDHTEYEPENFPGLIYRIIKPSATFLIFSSGKFVCMGCKNKEEIEDSIKYLKKEIEKLLEIK